MNDGSSKLEQELATLAPRRLSPEARQEIRDALARAEVTSPIAVPRRREWVSVAAVAAGVALVAGGILVLLRRGPTPPAAPEKPVVARADDEELVIQDEKVLHRVVDEGLVDFAKGPARLYRVQTVRQVRRHDPARGAVLEYIDPREDVMLVGLETY
ncbi:MAG: hypothetical protein V1809_07480 [Planctomycetota bacterium]